MSKIKEEQDKAASKIQAHVRGDQTRANVADLSGKKSSGKKSSGKKSSGKKRSGKHGKHCISKFHEHALLMIEQQLNIVITEAEKDILIEHAKKFPEGGCQTTMKKK